MGRLVNVVLPSGRVVAVDEDVAKAGQLSRDTLGSEAASVEARSNTEQSSGLVEGLKAAGEGALDTATFGLYGAARGALDHEGAEDMRIRAQERSGSRLVGEIGAVVLPGLGAAGLLGKAGGAAAKATAPGLARAAGEVYGGVGGQFVEGALLGAGGNIAQTNVTGDPLTIESMVIDAGIGGIIDMGLHAAANKVEGMAWNAKKAQAKAGVLKEELQTYEKGTKAFSDTPPSWNEFVELHEAKRKSVRAYNAEVRKEAEAYVEHLSPAGLNKVIGDFDKARATVQAEVTRDPAVREALAKHSTEQRKYQAVQRDYEKIVNDDADFTGRLKGIQSVLESKADEFAPLGAPGNIHKVKNVGVQGEVGEGGRFKRAPKYAVYQKGTPKQVISSEMDAKLKDFNKRLSRVYQLKTGKYKGKLGDWEKKGEEVSFGDAVRDAADKAEAFGERKAFVSSVYDNLPANVKPATLEDFKTKLFEAHRSGDVVLARADLVAAMDQGKVAASEIKANGADFHFVVRGEGNKAAKAAKGVSDPKADYQTALEEAAQLREDLVGWLGGKKIPKIPKKPVPPPEPDVLVNGRAAELVGTSREISKGVEDARTMMREGRYEDASLILSDLRAKTGAKVKDLALPDMPLAPRPPKAEIPVELPKSLDDFARKHAPQVAELARHVSDPQTQAALYRVMKDLDLKVTGDPMVDVSAMHKTLGDYHRTMTKLNEDAAKKKATDASKPTIVRLMNRMVRLTAGRAADVGGILGGITRTAGSEAAVRGMGAVESATFGAAMMQSRTTVKDRVRNIVGKYGVPAAGAVRKLAPPMAYLKQGFISGEADKETDPAKLAVNRIHELQSAAMAAPDAAFLAVQGMLDQPDDIAWKMHQHVVGSLNYLVSTLPKDPGTDTKMFSSNWSPQYHEAIALAHRIEAVQAPLDAISRAIAGDSHPAATEALWAVYPSVMNELAAELSVAAPHMKNLTYEQASAYSNLFRTPLTGLQQPVVVSALQGMYMTGPQQSAPPPGRPTGGASKQAPGRPAAVQSPLAGSSPGNLTGR